MTKKLESLLERAEKLDAEIARTETLALELEEREKELLASGAVDDPKIFGEVSTIRARRDLCPSRIARLQEQRDALLPELKVESERIRQKLNSVFFDASEKEAAKLKALLIPFLQEGNELNTLVSQLAHLSKNLRAVGRVTDVAEGVWAQHLEDPVPFARAAVRCANDLEKFKD